MSSSPRYRSFGISAIVVILVIGLGGWFWSLGAVASEDVATIRLEVEKTADHPTVHLKRQGQNAWEDITTSAEVHIGDEIQTDADGEASIRWGDRGVTRLDRNTDLVIEDAPTDAEAMTNASIKLHIVSGRVWSRFLKLLDVDSQAQVTTDSVVATVRGTAFGISNVSDGTEVAVSDSVVSIDGVRSSSSTLVREGRWGKFDGSGVPTVVRDLMENDAWPQANIKLDRNFDEQMRKEIEARLKGQLKNGPAWLLNLSERLHLAMAAQKDRDQLGVRYLERRIGERLLGQGRRPLANQLNDLKKLRGHARETALKTVRQAIFLRTKNTSAISDPSIQEFQRLRHLLLEEKSSNTVYADLLDIDDRIDDVIADRVTSGRMDVIENLKIQIEQIKTRGTLRGLDVNERARIDLKIKALEERLRDEIGDATTPEIEPGLLDTTSTSDNTTPVTQTKNDLPITNKTNPVVQPTPTAPAPSTPPVVTNTTCAYQSLKLVAKPQTLGVGQTTYLTLFGLCKDGSMNDVTSLASFYLASAKDGTLFGNEFMPAHTGTIPITGRMVDHGTTKETTLYLSVTGSVRRLELISVTTPGGTALTTGQSAPLEAKATYSDNTSSFVTYQCNWSTSDAKKATISNAKFYTLSGTGDVAAVCSYTEGGITQTGSLMFTIKLDPALQPFNGSPAVPGGNNFVPPPIN